MAGPGDSHDVGHECYLQGGHGARTEKTLHVHVNGMMKWYAPTAAVFLTFDDNPNDEASEEKEDCYISTLSDRQEGNSWN